MVSWFSYIGHRSHRLKRVEGRTRFEEMITSTFVHASRMSQISNLCAYKQRCPGLCLLDWLMVMLGDLQRNLAREICPSRILLQERWLENPWFNEHLSRKLPSSYLVESLPQSLQACTIIRSRMSCSGFPFPQVTCLRIKADGPWYASPRSSPSNPLPITRGHNSPCNVPSSGNDWAKAFILNPPSQSLISHNSINSINTPITSSITTLFPPFSFTSPPHSQGWRKRNTAPILPFSQYPLSSNISLPPSLTSTPSHQQHPP